METLRARVRTRLVPALLASTAITLIVAGLLTYTQPVTADPGRIGAGGVVGTADHLPAARLGDARMPRRTRSASPRGSGSRSWDRSAGRQGQGRLSALRCGPVDGGHRTSPAGPGSRDVPLRPRSAGHVPAAARDTRSRASAASRSRSGRATTSATSTRSSMCAGTSRTWPPPRPLNASSSGSRRPRARTPPTARPRSWPSSCRRNRPATQPRTRRRARRRVDAATQTFAKPRNVAGASMHQTR